MFKNGKNVGGGGVKSSNTTLSQNYNAKAFKLEDINLNNIKTKSNRNKKLATLLVMVWLFVIGLTIAVFCVINNNKPNLPINIYSAYVVDDGSTATAFAGGNGTESSPYQISNAMQLRLLSTNPSHWGSSGNEVYFELTNDIEYNTNSWTPIGTSTNRFYGNFNGNYYRITFTQAITISSGYGGVFGVVSGEIYNLGVDWGNGLTVNNADDVGGIIACADSGSISNCYNLGNLNVSANKSTDVYVGGIVGLLQSQLSNCYNAGDVTAEGTGLSCGGIIGHTSLSISNCYNVGSIFVSSENESIGVGGIAGFSMYSPYNVYNKGDLSGISTNTSTSVGGILGIGPGSSTSSAFHINGEIVSQGNNQANSHIGGILGKYISSSGGGSEIGLPKREITALNISPDGYGCYYSPIDTAGATVYELGVEVANLGNYLKTESAFTNGFTVDGTLLTWNSNHPWDFTDTWGLNPNVNDGYPILRDLSNVNVTYIIDNGDYSQTQEDSYNFAEMQSITLANNTTFTRQGYTYSAWTDGVNTYPCGASVTLTKNTTLYPVWESTYQDFTITLDANGGENGSVTTLVVTQSVPQKTQFSISELPTKLGYSFNGFYTSQTSGTQYISADGVVLMGTEYYMDVIPTLYAQWTPVSYTISYYIVIDNQVSVWNDASNLNTKSYTIETSVTTFTPPTIPQGYNFIGWSTTSNGQITSTAPSINVGSTGNKTYYAHFTPQVLNLTLNCENYDISQYYLINIYKGEELIMQIAPNVSITLQLSYIDYASTMYSLQFVGGYYASVNATGDNFTQIGSRIYITSFADTTINYNINSITSGINNSIIV